ncbi:MAG: SDR family oxidoreductase [Chloroflexota bacterium]
MHIVIFGATGGTGRVLVAQALGAGHAVTAFVRDPSQIATRHERLTLAQGDMGDAARVAEAIKGQDAVLSAFGPRRGSKDTDLLAVGTRHILAAMRQHGVRRFISQSGAGVVDERDEPSLVRTLIRALLKLSAPHVLADAEQQFALVKASDLDWTMVRVPRLKEGAPTGKYRVGYKPPAGAAVTRGDIAEFMLKQLTDKTYLRQAPFIGY